MNKSIHIVFLTYSIMFNDSDEGNCYAGEGKRIVRVFKEQKKAEDLIKEWSPIIKQAEKENIVFPRQPDNIKLRKEFGFDLHDLDQGNENFQLNIESVEVTE